MTTYTIEITDVPDDLLLRLDQQAQQQGIDRSALIRDLLQRAIKEKELTKFVNAEIHQMRRERRERKALTETVHQEAA